MARSLFTNKDEGRCEICIHGKTANDPTKVLCCKKGVVDASARCHRYKYDPLKRVPHHAPLLPTFDSSEFKL